jgi:hypothetical protein
MGTTQPPSPVAIFLSTQDILRHIAQDMSLPPNAASVVAAFDTLVISGKIRRFVKDFWEFESYEALSIGNHNSAPDLLPVPMSHQEQSLPVESHNITGGVPAPGVQVLTLESILGPQRDHPSRVFVNQTDEGNTHFLRTHGLNARPDLKAHVSLRFRQVVKQWPDVVTPDNEEILVFLESQDLEEPLTLVCSAKHLEIDGLRVEQGLVIEIPLV